MDRLSAVFIAFGVMFIGTVLFWLLIWLNVQIYKTLF